MDAPADGQIYISGKPVKIIRWDRVQGGTVNTTSNINNVGTYPDETVVIFPIAGEEAVNHIKFDSRATFRHFIRGSNAEVARTTANLHFEYDLFSGNYVGSDGTTLETQTHHIGNFTFTITAFEDPEGFTFNHDRKIFFEAKAYTEKNRPYIEFYYHWRQALHLPGYICNDIDDVGAVHFFGDGDVKNDHGRVAKHIGEKSREISPALTPTSTRSRDTDGTRSSITESTKTESMSMEGEQSLPLMDTPVTMNIQFGNSVNFRKRATIGIIKDELIGKFHAHSSQVEELVAAFLLAVDEETGIRAVEGRHLIEDAVPANRPVNLTGSGLPEISMSGGGEEGLILMVPLTAEYLKEHNQKVLEKNTGNRCGYLQVDDGVLVIDKDETKNLLTAFIRWIAVLRNSNSPDELGEILVTYWGRITIERGLPNTNQELLKQALQVSTNSEDEDSQKAKTQKGTDLSYEVRTNPSNELKMTTHDMNGLSIKKADEKFSKKIELPFKFFYDSNLAHCCLVTEPDKRSTTVRELSKTSASSFVEGKIYVERVKVEKAKMYKIKIVFQGNILDKLKAPFVMELKASRNGDDLVGNRFHKITIE